MKRNRAPFLSHLSHDSARVPALATSVSEAMSFHRKTVFSGRKGRQVGIKAVDVLEGRDSKREFQTRK